MTHRLFIGCWFIVFLLALMTNNTSHANQVLPLTYYLPYVMNSGNEENITPTPTLAPDYSHLMTLIAQLATQTVVAEHTQQALTQMAMTPTLGPTDQTPLPTLTNTMAATSTNIPPTSTIPAPTGTNTPVPPTATASKRP